MKEQSARSFRRQIQCNPQCERLEDRLVLSGNTLLASPASVLAFTSRSRENAALVQVPSPPGNQQQLNYAVDNGTSGQNSQFNGNAVSGSNSLSTSGQDKDHSSSTSTDSGNSKSGNQSNGSSDTKTGSGKPVAHKPGESTKPKRSEKTDTEITGPTRPETEPVPRDVSQFIGLLADNDPDSDSTPDGQPVAMDAMVANNLKVGWLRPDLLDLPALGVKDMPGRSAGEQQTGWLSSTRGDTSYEREPAEELEQGPGTAVVAIPVAKVLLPDLDDSSGLAAFTPEGSYSLEMALSQFLENVEQFGEDLVAAIKKTPLASWLAVLAATAVAAELTRRRWQYEREQRALEAAHGDGTLTWSLGWPGNFSSVED
jgi:hypothetical protein